ncbi:MAG: FISUMP domain-containing protein [bacterium]|nr:FISUMP domain-containing protein [bacterium]
MNYKKNPKQIYIAAVVIAIAATILIYHNFSARSASHGWLQTDWSGGASTTAEAVHPGDEEGWTYYYSKDDVISASTPGEISIGSTTASWIETATADFAAGTLTGAAATSGKVVLLKPAGVACSAGAECLSGYCQGTNVCAVCETFTYETQEYDTVIIGEQCWMAENLNVGTYVASVNTGVSHSDVTNNGIIEKYCYSNVEANCATYGGLYDWDEMMGYIETAGTQGICPSGWHIPTDAEQYELENYLTDAGQTCSASRSGAWDCAFAGSKLKSGGSSGFQALLAGNRYSTGSFSNLSSYASFWSSSISGSYAWYRFLISTEARVIRATYSQTYGFSARCLKD